MLLEVRAASRGPGIGPDELLQRAASAEQYSSHVLAASVMEAADRRRLPLLAAKGATEYATHGVWADFGNCTVVVGKRRFVEEKAAWVEKARLTSGQMAVYVGVDGVFAGTLIM